MVNAMIVGETDSRQVVAWETFQAFARYGRCTATHVGRGFFLTAGHCLTEDIGFRGFRNAPCGAPLRLFDNRRLECTVVAFGFDRRSDHALLRVVDPAQAADLPAYPVDYDFDWARAGRRQVMLFGLSQGQARVNASCTARYRGAGQALLHDCDTDPGDSGAALIDWGTQHIVAVHGGAESTGANYAWPTRQVPWAETLCVAIGSSEPLLIRPSEAPATWRLSTSHVDGAFRHLIIDLGGRLPAADLAVTVLTPEVTHRVGLDELRIGAGHRWWYQAQYALSRSTPGPWAVEVANVAEAGAPGQVEGRIWVCP
jgi:hypothetical protein